MGLESSPAMFRMSPVPFGRRLRLTSDVGPDLSGSNPGFACAQMPEKSGMASALSLCPSTGVATAAASASAKGKFRHCKSIALLLDRHSSPDACATLHPLRAGLEGRGPVTGSGAVTGPSGSAPGKQTIFKHLARLW